MGIHELIRKTDMAQAGREQERETMDKTTLCNCTPNSHKLVCQVPLCGG